MTSVSPESFDADRLEKVVTAIVVIASAVFVFWQLQPDLIFSNSTPTGGDMGAHVWGPAFLRDELLPRFRLSGWTPDWYSGFPAFHFYMVLPALAIVILDVGLHPIISIPLVLALAVMAISTRLVGRRLLSVRLTVALAILAPLLIGLPYNIAFKLIAVSGVVMFPVAAWALGHFGGLRFPGPAVLSVASLAFAFDRSFNIYGGNIASTLAGEFAASISLSFSLVALGLIIRGTRTGEYKIQAAIFIALTGLSHLLPAFFLLAAVFLVMAVRLIQGRLRSVPWMLTAGTLSAMLSAFWVLPFFLRTDYLNDMGWERIEILHSPLVTRSNLNPANVLSDYPPLPVLLVLAALGLVLSLIRRVELGGLLGLTAGLMALGFIYFPDGRLWNARILPFYYLSVTLLAGVGVYLLIVELVKAPFVIRLVLLASSRVLLLPTQIRDAKVWPEPGTDADYLTDAAGYTFRVLAIVMVVAVLGTEIPRQLGRGLLSHEVVAAVCAGGLLLATPARDVTRETVTTIEGAWWLVVAMLALVTLLVAVLLSAQRLYATFKERSSDLDALATDPPPTVLTIDGGEAVGSANEISMDDGDQVEPRSSIFGLSNRRAALLAAPIVVMTSIFILLGLALNTLGGTNESGGERSWTFGGVAITSNDNSFIPGWSTWNFSGLEAKSATLGSPGDVGQGGWEEYQYVQRTMAGVGEQVGCGRAMWEFAPELNRYGTTMAMMLLPMWTDGCIGSMEGLFFEATPTVPYHFMLQSDLSGPSRQAGADQTVGGPSRAMRDLPYGEFDIDRGVDRMHELGVRYYLAFSPQTIKAARAHPMLAEITTASPWVIFETQAVLVEALDVAPVVIDGVRNHQDQWLDVGIEWFDELDAVRPASAGPEAWRRVDVDDVSPRYEAEGATLAGSIGPEDLALSEILPIDEIVETTTVSNIVAETDRISFSVDQVGTPVLIRASYFPSWKTIGADGPYRVAPNFMVVVPTQADVELVFGRTAADWSATILTLLGIAAVLAMAIGARIRPKPIALIPDEDFDTPAPPSVP
ncbi:MAG: hypothetical protein ACI81L_000386 [Verrucomicrobiales bacterium]|jgi:hypothetical protein